MSALLDHHATVYCRVGDRYYIIACKLVHTVYLHTVCVPVLYKFQKKRLLLYTLIFYSDDKV